MQATRQVIVTALIALFGAGAAVAQEATPDTWIAAGATTKSRADVQAELAQARRDGSIKAASAGYLPRIASTLSREQVRADVAAARASGELAALNGEVYGLRAAPPAVSTVVAGTAR